MSEINYDQSYTTFLNDSVKQRYGSTAKRAATHLSDVLYCLRKAWGKHHLDEGDWSLADDDGDPIVMWAGGLQFEELVGTGEPQVPSAYCFTCRAVSSVPAPVDGIEKATCGVCDNRWLIGTPDYRVPDGKGNMIIHEAKQTRKSQRRGPQDAPWWIEQLEGYLFFDHVRNPLAPSWGRLVVNWLMGDYGEKKKGKRPRPPRSVIEAFTVTFDGKWEDYMQELSRRKSIVEGPDQPPLNGMHVGYAGANCLERTPAYPWECSSCPVGKVIGCEHWVWDDSDNLIVPGKEEENVAIQEG